MTERLKAKARSNPEDFLLPDFPELENVTLPSGLRVKLRSPAREEFWTRAGEPPDFLMPSKDRKVPRPDHAEMVSWSFRMLSALVAEPVFSLEPKEGEFHPRRLKPEDRAFLGQYFARHTGIDPGSDAAPAAQRQKKRGKSGARKVGRG